ncbi:uncharacterized protein IL334_003677 [Kwoniella shivajii]|uniref:BZIP domain-containing protein n=1 Tax=Kwoniella shivajii TaxID=564305 RepID=A0ABZ1CY90_9TREE|nr:hypothetical protein IL334_003677 [Kwoniella shivajii]
MTVNNTLRVLPQLQIPHHTQLSFPPTNPPCSLTYLPHNETFAIQPYQSNHYLPSSASASASTSTSPTMSATTSHHLPTLRTPTTSPTANILEGGQTGPPKSRVKKRKRNEEKPNAENGKKERSKRRRGECQYQRKMEKAKGPPSWLKFPARAVHSSSSAPPAPPAPRRPPSLSQALPAQPGYYDPTASSLHVSYSHPCYTTYVAERLTPMPSSQPRWIPLQHPNFIHNALPPPSYFESDSPVNAGSASWSNDAIVCVPSRRSSETVDLNNRYGSMIDLSPQVVIPASISHQGPPSFSEAEYKPPLISTGLSTWPSSSSGLSGMLGIAPARGFLEAHQPSLNMSMYRTRVEDA